MPFCFVSSTQIMTSGERVSLPQFPEPLFPAAAPRWEKAEGGHGHRQYTTESRDRGKPSVLIWHQPLHVRPYGYPDCTIVSMSCALGGRLRHPFAPPSAPSRRLSYVHITWVKSASSRQKTADKDLWGSHPVDFLLAARHAMSKSWSGTFGPEAAYSVEAEFTGIEVFKKSSGRVDLVWNLPFGFGNRGIGRRGSGSECATCESK